MLRSFALAIGLGAGLSIACSPAPRPTYAYNELQPGVVQVLRTSETIMPAPGGGFVMATDTVGVFRMTDLRASLRARFSDSALVFMGRFDSLRYDDTGSTFMPDIDLMPDSMPLYPFHSVLMRLQVDTVLRGTFPLARRPVWLRVYGGQLTCTVPFSGYLNKSFFNASGNFETKSDLNIAFQAFPGWSPYPDAYWFDGRYLESPDFPGLRLDITELDPDYPATSVAPRRPPLAPLRPDGKLYRADGRTVPAGKSNSPSPVLR